MQPTFIVQSLERRHERSAFACGVEALDRYLQQQARQDADKRVAATFVLVRPTSPHVLGYCALSASIIRANELPDELSSKLPRHPQMPVTLLGRLAIDNTLRGQRMGQFLLMDAQWRSLTAAAQIAAIAVVVDAKSKSAEAFYAHFGFIPLQQQPARMLLPMKTVAGLSGERPHWVWRCVRVALIATARVRKRRWV